MNDDLRVRPVGPEDREPLERLWLMFRHDMAEFQGDLPTADGSYRSERLESALRDPDWCGYLATLGERPVSFAFVRALGAPVRVLNSFFVVRGLRRSGIGLRVVRAVVACHPGRWSVAFQDGNHGAVAFWRRVADDLGDGDWEEWRQGVSECADVPADVWIAFTVGS